MTTTLPRLGSIYCSIQGCSVPQWELIGYSDFSAILRPVGDLKQALEQDSLGRGLEPIEEIKVNVGWLNGREVASCS